MTAAVDGPHVFAEVSLAQQRVRNVPRSADELAIHLNLSKFPTLVAHFLWDQLHPNNPLVEGRQPPASYYQDLNDARLSRFSIFKSAMATYYAPSDLSGIGGMRREHIRATDSWLKGPPRYDCIFIETDASQVGMRGLHIGRVKLFFSFFRDGVCFPCALIEWFEVIGSEADELTGMWVVEPEFSMTGERECAVVHIDSLVRAAHLIPRYGSEFIPSNFDHFDSLDAFRAYYVNKFIDHHAHEIAF
ncbi:hypothetical protein QCA50_015536 [Cerrena zonata]|uniref:Uncharacterized protein n=1 Tax=Cerrena zonata TaxID=2478898 RepID=A0AAW0FT68_9APHY